MTWMFYCKFFFLFFSCLIGIKVWCERMQCPKPRTSEKWKDDKHQMIDYKVDCHCQQQTTPHTINNYWQRGEKNTKQTRKKHVLCKLKINRNLNSEKKQKVSLVQHHKHIIGIIGKMATDNQHWHLFAEWHHFFWIKRK